MTWFEIIELTVCAVLNKLTKKKVEEDCPISMNLRSLIVAKVASVSLESYNSFLMNMPIIMITKTILNPVQSLSKYSS
jgi:hypothetical protein